MAENGILPDASHIIFLNVEYGAKIANLPRWAEMEAELGATTLLQCKVGLTGG